MPNFEETIWKMTGDSRSAEESIARMRSAWGQMGAAFRDLPSATGTANAAMQSTTSTVGGLISSLLHMNPASLLAAAGLGGVAVKLNQLKNEIIAVVGESQTLTISLKALAARELVRTGDFENAQEAMGQAAVAADYLLRELQLIGLESPYENQMVVQTFRLAQSFNFAAEEGLTLTKAMLDLAAGLGKSGYDMQRIMYNLGQINMVGKITQRDLRDLRFIGVDLADVLRDELGVSVEEFNTGLANGSRNTGELVDALDGFVKKNFAGAAKEMARTWTGLMSSIKDLKEISLISVFKPAFDQITAFAADIFGKISDFVTESGKLEAAGQKLSAFVGKIIDGFRNLMTVGGPALDVVKGVGSFLASVLRDAGAWLKSIAFDLEHIADAVKDRLAPAFEWIRNLVSKIDFSAMAVHFRDTVNAILSSVSWMLKGIEKIIRGDSEGAVRPLNEAFLNILTLVVMTWDRFIADALTWGWNLVVQIANGIIRAAQTVLVRALTYLGNVIGGFLKPGSPPKKGPLSEIFNWGKGVFEVFLSAFKVADFGALREAMAPVKQILTSAMSSGKIDIFKYADLYRAAQSQIGQLIASYRQTGQISESILGGIAETLGEGSEELVKYLKLQMQHRKALDDLAAVQGEVEEAAKSGFVSDDLKERLALAQQAAAQAEEEFNWQKELLALQQEGVDLQMRLVEALEKLAAGGGGGGGAGGGGGGGLGEATPVEPEFESILGGLGGGEQLEIGIDTSAIGEAVGGISEQFAAMREQVRAWIEMPIEQKLGDIVTKFQELTGVNLQPIIDFLSLPLEGKIGAIDERIGELWPKWESFKQSWGVGWYLVSSSVQTAVGVIVDEVWPRLQDTFDQLRESFGIGEGEISDVWGLIESIIVNAGWVIGAVFTGLAALVTGVINGIVRGFQFFVEAWSAARRSFELIGEGLKQFFHGLLEVVFGILDGDMGKVFQGFKDTFAGVGKAVVGVVGWIGGMFTTGFAFISGLIVGFVEGAFEFFSDFVDKVVGDTGVIPKLISKAKEIFGELQDRVGPIIDGFVAGFLTPLSDSLSAIKDIFDTIKKKIGEFGDALKGADSLIPDWLRPGSPTPFEIGLLGISDALSKAVSDMDSFGDVVGVIGGGAVAAGAGVSGGAVTVNQVFEGGLNFPAVRGGRDAVDVRRSLERNALEARMRSRIKFGL